MEERNGVKPRNLFAGGTLDRAPKRRADEGWLATRFSDPRSRIVPIRKTRNLVTRNENPRAVWLPGGHPDLQAEAATGPVFLGIVGDTVYFAVEVTADLPAHGEFADLRRVAALLDPAEGSVLAYARGMIYWHVRHRFCGLCGSPTRSRQGGHVRRCRNADCGASHFPRTDPAIIVLVTDNNRCLLTRQQPWPRAYYSALAGFVEPGESVGEAVEREVAEETGIEIDSVRYHSSQPWPFPSSLMLGFTATYRAGALEVDHEELEDARWCEREELRKLIAAGEMRLPPRPSIARRLIDEWLNA